MPKKTISRRELIKLAATVSAFGAALGFFPRKGNSWGQGTRSNTFLKIELKLYKENILVYTHELPKNISSHFATSGNRLEFKFFREGEQLPNSWSWGGR